MSKVVKRTKLKRPFKIALGMVLVVVFGVFLSFFWSSDDKLEEKEEDNDVEDIEEVVKAWNKDDNIFTNENNSLLDKMRYIASLDSRFSKVVEDFESYPEEMLAMLIKNPDMSSFVLDYKDKKDKAASDDVGYVVKGVLPLLLQYDERWGYNSYGEGMIALTGCGPTALSMVVTGLTGNNTYTPKAIGDFAEEKGYYTSVGTSWDLMTKGVESFGVEGREIALNKNIILRELRSGHPVICSMKPGEFTALGHFIVLVREENGKFKINDPNSRERSNRLWDYEELEDQIKNLWAFQVKA